MFIDDLPVGSPITLRILHGNKKMELVSIIRDKKRHDNADYHCCYVEPFTHKNKILKFDVGTLFAICDSIGDGKQYKYKLLQISLVRIGNVVYHRLVSQDNAKFLNRREAVRVPLNVTANLSTSVGNIIGKTRDISASGIAVLIGSARNVNVGDRVRCKFEKFYTTYNVSCKVVRIVRDGKTNRYLLGCEFERNYQDINLLVNDIRMQHRNNRGVKR